MARHGSSPRIKAQVVTLCGSLSRLPVSLGAAMHNAGYRALGLPFVYVPFRTTHLEGAVAGMRAMGIRGFGVSMPFKLEITRLCDELEPLAERIGAVNTVVNDDGRLTGHNTDWSGAVRALAEALPLEGARVIVLGAGGAARSVAHGLRQADAAVTLCNRTDERARQLARTIGCNHTPWAERTRGDYDGIVNATSLGQADVDDPHGARSPWPQDGLAAGQVVMDIVYKPLETPLLVAARARGAKTVHGGRMLLYQAARQFELYTGRHPPLAAMAAALERAMAEQAGAKE